MAVRNIQIFTTRLSFFNEYEIYGTTYEYIYTFMHTYIQTSLVPRPSPAPVFDRLQYAQTEGELEGARLVSCPDPTLSRGETVW